MNKVRQLDIKIRRTNPPCYLGLQAPIYQIALQPFTPESLTVQVWFKKVWWRSTYHAGVEIGLHVDRTNSCGPHPYSRLSKMGVGW